MTERSSVTPLMRSVRDRHVSIILRQLLREPLARKELARRTEISFTTITRLVSTMLAAGIIEELPARRGRATSGRPETPLGFPPNGRVVIGAHIHADSSTVSAFTLTGEQVDSSIIEHDHSPDRTIPAAVALTGELIARVGRERVVGVGVSTGGVVDFDTGTVMSSPQLNWSGVPLRTPFLDGLNVPVVVDNSVRALAITRLQQSHSADTSMLVVWVGGIVSSAIAMGSLVHRGPGATAGTVTHLPVSTGPGALCDCGVHDCLGLIASDKAVIQRAVAAGILEADAPFSALYEAEAHQPMVAELLRHRADYLADGLSQLIQIVNPSLTILAGRIGSDRIVQRCLDHALDRCRHTLGGDRRIIHWPIRKPEWDRASAALVLDDYVRRPTWYEAALL